MMFQISQQSDSIITEEEIKQALDIISKEKHGDKALDILNIISYFSPENIHTGVFLSLVANGEELGSAIKLLKQYSIVDAGEEKSVINVNSLVQEIKRTNLKEQKKEEEVLKSALVLFCLCSINSNNLDHAISAWNYVSEYPELVKEFSDFTNTIVDSLGNSGRHREYFVFVKKQCNLLQCTLGVDHINTLKMKNNMALMLSNCGKYQEALDIFQEVYKKFKKVEKMDHEYILILQHNIGFALSNLGKNEEALSVYKEIFERRKEILGANHPDTLLAQTNIAILLSKQKDKHSMALGTLNEIYNKQKELLGPSDLATLTTQHNMGSVLLEQGRYQESVDNLNQVFNKRKRILGLDHSSTIITWSRMAQVLFRQNKHNESIAIIQEVLKVFSKSYGADHPETLKICSEIAADLLKEGRDQEGLDICNQVYNRRKELLGFDHSNTLVNKSIVDKGKLLSVDDDSRDVDNLISLWEDVRDDAVMLKEFSWLPYKIIEKLHDDLKYEKAISFGKEAIRLLKKIVGSKHVNTLFAQTKMALVLGANGRHKEALDSYQEVYRHSKGIYYNEDMLITQHNIAVTLLELGEYQEALDIFNEVLKQQKETEQDDLFTLTIQSNIARIFNKQCKYEKSINMYKKVCSKQKKMLGANDLFAINTRNNMAAVLFRHGKHQEALNIFEDVLARKEKLLGKDHPETVLTQNNIGRVLLLQGNNQEGLTVIQDAYYKSAKILGVNNLFTLRIKNLIAQALHRLDKFQESFNIYQETYPKLKEILGLCHPEVSGTKDAIDEVRTLLEMKIMLNKNPLSLHSFAKEGNLSKVRSLIRNGANVNYKDENGETPLHYAARHGHLNVATHLLKEGAVYNCKNKEGKKPSQLAENSDIKILLNFVAKLFNDVKAGNHEQVAKLVSKGGVIVNVKEDGGGSPLYWSAQNGHEKTVKVLLEGGADVTQVTNKGVTPLHIATSKGYKESVKVLLQHASHNKLNDCINMQITVSGATSLHVAAKNGSLEIVKSLLRYGAIYNIENKEGKTSYDVSENQNVKNLLKLIDELFVDAKSGNIEIISKLKAVKPDEFAALTNARNSQANTLLQVAITNKHKNIACELLEMLKQTD